MRIEIRLNLKAIWNQTSWLASFGASSSTERLIAYWNKTRSMNSLTMFQLQNDATKRVMTGRGVAVLVLSGVWRAQPDLSPNNPPVTARRRRLRVGQERDRDVARQFYRKYIDVKGSAVVAAGEVADLALQRTHLHRHPLRLAGRRYRVKWSRTACISSSSQGPGLYRHAEYRHHPNSAYKTTRARSGGKPTSFGEENLLNLPLTAMTTRDWHPPNSATP